MERGRDCRAVQCWTECLGKEERLGLYNIRQSTLERRRDWRVVHDWTEYLGKEKRLILRAVQDWTEYLGKEERLEGGTRLDRVP